MKYFVIGDTHSFYREMIRALNRADFDETNPNHKVILCGDAFDRGEETVQLFEWMKRMISLDKLIYIRGNHEDLLIRSLRRGYISDTDISNGTAKTIRHLAEVVIKEPVTDSMLIDDPKRYIDAVYDSGVVGFINEHCLNFFETKNYIFTHGFLPVEYDEDMTTLKLNPNWKDASTSEWQQATWLNGMKISKIDGVQVEGKTIVVGHYHTSYGHVREARGWNISDRVAQTLEFDSDAYFGIYYGNGLIAIDGCTAYTHKVNCLVIEDELE